MSHDLDIQHCAEQMIEAHGGLAREHAELCAALLDATGDVLQATIWRRIAKTICTLRQGGLQPARMNAA